MFWLHMYKRSLYRMHVHVYTCICNWYNSFSFSNFVSYLNKRKCLSFLLMKSDIDYHKKFKMWISITFFYTNFSSPLFMYALFRDRCFFQSVVHVLLVEPSPFQLHWYRTYIILAAFSGVSLWTPNYRILYSSFWCKDRNNRGIENWGSKTLYVWLHPQPFPRFRHFIFILKIRTNLHVENKQINN